MDEDLGDAERLGHETGVLPPSPAEAEEGVPPRHIVPALDADLLDRKGHLVHRDGEEALGTLLRGHLPAG